LITVHWWALILAIFVGLIFGDIATTIIRVVCRRHRARRFAIQVEQWSKKEH
jgi:H+/Cl- antiporter ClcA